MLSRGVPSLIRTDRETHCTHRRQGKRANRNLRVGTYSMRAADGFNADGHAPAPRAPSAARAPKKRCRRAWRRAAGAEQELGGWQELAVVAHSGEWHGARGRGTPALGRASQ